MLGIQALEPGFKRFQINPQFTKKLNNLSGSVPTINGDIKVSWSITANQLSMTLSVPNNSQAQLQLPSITQLQVTKNGQPIKNPLQLTAGDYQITGITSL
jgi:alpha-L-rhamnosidase